jgi:hypothetical protein
LRKTKHRVLDSVDDPRVRDPDFASAPGVFANNDIKYETNKRRAQVFAAEQGEVVVWSMAKDKANDEVLKQCPPTLDVKYGWLSKHDKETADLYGALPLVHGMPVALTEHVDRRPEFNLLRGRVGHLHGWVFDPKDTSEVIGGRRTLQKPPLVVFVKYDGVAWRIGDLDVGVYPIFPVDRSWFLDKYRDRPVLRVSRRQIPLAPAFAMTAHASQGQTLVRVVVDLQIPREAKIVTCYVVLSRVRTRAAILIYRPFRHEHFQRGVAEGPSILLAHLRGEEIDWAAVKSRYCPTERRCKECREKKGAQFFSDWQWSKKYGCGRLCAVCEEEDLRKPMVCSRCGDSKEKRNFSTNQREKVRVAERCCNSCEKVMRKSGLRLCTGPCRETKTQAEFSDTKLDRGNQRVCKACLAALVRCMGACGREKKQEEFVRRELESDSPVCQACAVAAEMLDCGGTCNLTKARTDFSHTQLKRGDKRICRSCIEKASQSCIEEASKAWAMLDCAGECNLTKARTDFSHTQLERGDKRICQSCIEKASKTRADDAARADDEMLDCAGECGLSKVRTEFSRRQQNHGRVCKDCVKTLAKGRVCAECGGTKSADLYDGKQWTAGSGRICKECRTKSTKGHVEKQWGHYSCWKCKKQKPKTDFSKCRPASRLGTKRARCNVCIDFEDVDAKRVNTCGSMIKKTGM